MAKVFLQPTDTSYKISNSNTFIYGNNNSREAQRIEIEANIENIIVDANVGDVVFAANYSEYKFLQKGNGIDVIKNDKLVASLGIQDDSDGTLLKFLDKSAQAKFNLNVSQKLVIDIVTLASEGNTKITNSKPLVDVYPVLTGKAIDGYLKNADVFADANENGVRDKNEAKTTTDALGNFTLNNAKGTIIVSGGTDLSTGQTFRGLLKAPAGSKVVTPFTTLLQSFLESGQNFTDAKQSVGKAFGFDATGIDFTTYDPIAEFIATSKAPELQKTSGFLLTADNDSLAQTLFFLSTQLANFLVTATQTLQGAAGGSGNLSAKEATSALAKALVSAISNAIESGQTVSFSDSNLLKEVVVEGAKNASNANSTETPKFNEAAFTARVNALANTVAEVLKDAADNITKAAEKGGNALDILNNVDKVSSFTQNNAGDVLGKLAEALNPENTAELTASLQETLGSLTGDAATKIIAEMVVNTFTAMAEAFKDLIPTPEPQEPTPIPEPSKEEENASEQPEANPTPPPPESPPYTPPPYVPPPESTLSISISEAGSKDAGAAKIAFNFLAGNYLYNITKFFTGDSLKFPAGQNVTINNEKLDDGKVELNWATKGNEITVILSNLTAEQDKSLLFESSLNQQFGNGTLTYAAVTSSSGNSPITQTINADGSQNAGLGNVAFNVVAGNYTFTIAEFASGDTLHFPSSQAPTILNENLNDGSAQLNWADNGQAVVILLTGLTAEQDRALLFDSSLNAVFGANTLS